MKKRKMDENEARETPRPSKVRYEVDITSHKQAEDLIRILSDSSPIAVYLIQNGKFQFVNPEFQKLTGYSDGEMVGADSFKLVLAEDVSVVRGNAVRMLKGELSTPFEYRVVNKAGDIRWVMDKLVSIRVKGRRAALGYGMDITERKQAEEALRESEERYRRIVETAAEGIWVIDTEDKTVFVNGKMAEMLGYAVDEMMGQPLAAFMDEKGLAIAEPAAKHRRQGGEEQFDLRFRRKDGSVLWTIVSANHIFDKDGRYAGSLAMITDISKRKQAEEAQARMSAILEATSDFVATADVEGHTLYLNGAARRMLGIDEGEDISDLTMRTNHPAWAAALILDEGIPT
ncbi:MAG: PAS domain S-box protein [Chloroflexi bacterium]|nr:PAS domain S-box protein [Chloroflexota bacterium]